MADVNEVIKALEFCSNKYKCCTEGIGTKCPYDKFLGTCEDLCDECTTMLASDALMLLKEYAEIKNGVEPELEGDPGNGYWWVCGECHGSISRTDRFCRHCGRKVLQECSTN